MKIQRIKLTVILCLLYQILISQNYIPLRPAEMDSSEYNSWVKTLQKAFYEDSTGQCNGCKINIYASYYNLKEHKDTVFKYMNIAVSYDPYDACDVIYLANNAFSKLHEDALNPVQWGQIKCVCDSILSTIDHDLVNTLKLMKIDDQKYRKEMTNKDNTVLWIKQNILDSVNQFRVDSILLKYKTYPGKNLVGVTYQNALFLIIQHAPLSMQEKYLSLLKEAAKKNQMRKSNLCYIVDRILTAKNLPQVYGTQLNLNKDKNKYELFIIEDMENVDRRRSEMGLKPLKVYLKENGVEYPENK